jgi:hypothetical protein
VTKLAFQNHEEKPREGFWNRIWEGKWDKPGPPSLNAKQA